MYQDSLLGTEIPDSISLSIDDIRSLNFQAAKDIAKRSSLGPTLILIAMLVSSYSSGSYNDSPAISMVLLVSMLGCVIWRARVLHTLNSITQESFASWSRQFSGTVYATSVTWGLYLAFNIYSYEPSTVVMLVLIFTVGIAGAAAETLYIWKHVAYSYLTFLLIPSFIASLSHWNNISISLIFGLTAYFIFLYLQVTRSNQDYWHAAFNSRLLENQTHELLFAKLTAENASKAKSEFLSAMSHELRTPLNAVIGFSEILKNDVTSPLTTSQIESVNYITESGKHLLSLVDDVLDLSLLEDGRYKAELEAVDVMLAIEQACSMIAPQADKNNITLDNNTLLEEALYIEAEAKSFRQILLNFISNAVKYNKEYGYVSISCQTVDKGNLRVLVKDTGHGIADDLLANLFEPFNRLGNENSGIQGTGIGLAISQKLATAMGGKIGLTKNPDQGLTFWVEFKLSQS